jgi:hypothetical protein
MCSGIVLPDREATDEIVARYRLDSRRVSREGHVEFRFLYREPLPQLPVIHEGRLLIVSWGNRDDKASRLPRTGWCRSDSLAEGQWGWLHPEPVVIPACLGWEKGVWYQITEGIRGVLVRDEQGRPHAYMLTKHATHYYEIMTRHNWMPVLIDQVI